MTVNKPLVIISSSPHIHSNNSISKSMLEVILALIPTIIASIYYFRFYAVIIILSCVLSAVLFEALSQKIMNRPITINDGSAALTGLLLAFCLPPSISPILAVFGSFCAIVIGKQVFGGLGANIFNPAHLGRAILLASFPAAMTTWSLPLGAVDSITNATTSATPLALLRKAELLFHNGDDIFTSLPNLWTLFIGNTGGSLGETCVPAILVGGLFLIYRGHIDWRIPFYYILTVVTLTSLYGFVLGYPPFFPLYHLFAGGLMIGAFFMATDWVTSPITKKGKIIFALGLGLITVLIRLRGGYIEGVCYSILIMNMVTPLIDRYVRNRPFGGQKHEE